ADARPRDRRPAYGPHHQPGAGAAARRRPRRRAARRPSRRHRAHAARADGAAAARRDDRNVTDPALTGGRTLPPRRAEPNTYVPASGEVAAASARAPREAQPEEKAPRCRPTGRQLSRKAMRDACGPETVSP